jgi:uncharacterized membrane protein YbhN (UPF0104 family)
MAESPRQRPTFRNAQVALVPCAMAALGWFALGQANAIAPRGSPWYLLLALTALQASILCFAVRLRFSLRAFSIQLSTRDSAIVALQSLFYFFIPLSIGTDAARLLKIRVRAPDATRTTVLAAVLFDRATAAVACAIIAAATLPLIPSIQVAIPSLDTHKAGLWLIALAVAAAVSLAALWRFAGGKVQGLAQLIWRRGFILNTLACLGLSFLTQATTILAVWCGFQWIGSPVQTAAISLGVTGGAIAQVIPLSIAGAGPGEVTAGLLLGAAGATADQAILLATMVYFCKLIGGIEGGLLEWPPISRRLHA